MLDMTVKEFCDALAGSDPAPGGGGAAALAGALAASLGHMVGVFTAGKEKYRDVEADILSLMEEARDLENELLCCIDDDAEAFVPLSRAYSIPKDDPSREGIMEDCLRLAASVPLRIFRLCCRVIDLQEQFNAKGSVLLASDAACGAVLAQSAMRAAAVNVLVNVSSMKDREYAEDITAEVLSGTEEYKKRADDVYALVMGRYI